MWTRVSSGNRILGGGRFPKETGDLGGGGFEDIYTGPL